MQIVITHYNEYFKKVFLAVPHSMQDFSSPTRDWIHVLSIPALEA